MPTHRADIALWPKFEALSAMAQVHLERGNVGWAASVVLPDSPTPLVCVRNELQDAIVALLNESEERTTAIRLLTDGQG